MTERRIKRVYNYRSGLVVMIFEDGKDAILFDPPRLALWTFDNADEAFRYAKSNKIPTGDTIHVTERLPVPPRATGVGQASSYATAMFAVDRPVDVIDIPDQHINPQTSKVMGVGLHTKATESKSVVRHDDPENFTPIDSIALL